MASMYLYACKNYPGMETRPGHSIAETEGEIWKLMELYASVVRGENTGDWSDEDRQHLETLIKS